MSRSTIHAECNAFVYADSDSYRFTNSHIDSKPNQDANGYVNTYIHTNVYSNEYFNPDTNPKPDSDQYCHHYTDSIHHPDLDAVNHANEHTHRDADAI